MRNRMSVRYLGVLLKGVVISLLAPMVLAGAAQAAIQCYECHGGASDYRPLESGLFGTAGRNDATGGFTGNHQTHFGPITTQSVATIVCAYCHVSVSTTGHRNGLIEFSTNINSSPATGTYSKGPSFAQSSAPVTGTCSNINCHYETLTPLWGTTNISLAGPSAATCNVCHSSQLAGTPTKAHTTHLNYIGTTLNACGTCHPNHGQLGTGTQAFMHATSAGHRALNINFAAAPNNGIGTYSGAGASTAYPAYLPSQSPLRSGTCSATHCHSDGHIENGTALGSQNATPGAPAMVASWGSSWANFHCANCHGDGVSNAWPTYANSGPATTNSNSHGKHMTASGMGCQNCHVGTTTTGTSVIPGGLHLDKTVQVAFNATAGSLGSYAFNTKTCSATTCHGNGSPAWGGSTTCASCHESMGAWGTSTDTYNPAHQKHAQSTGYDFSCQNCHNSTTTTHATGPVTTFQSAEVKFNAAGTTVVSGLYGNSPVTYRTLPAMTTNPYNAAASAVPWYTGSTAIWATDSNNASVRYSAGTCGNVYCHSNAAPVDAANSYVNATWTTTPMTCGSCHSASGGSLKHAKHVTTYGFTCKSCHDSTVSSNTTISNAAMHVNAVKDVVFNVNAVTTGTYNNGTDTCTNIYCHSPGDKNIAPFNAPVRVATWTTTLGCDGCHGAMGAGLTTIASGSHSRHVTDQAPVFGAAFACEKCHALTVVGLTTINPTTGAANHVNQQVNVNFITTLNLSGLGTYTGSVVPGAANGSCSSVYCHSDGHIENGSGPGSQTNTPGVAALVPTWGTPWTTAQRCAACHGDGVSNAWPTYANAGPAATNANSHPKHMASSGIGCNNCHVATTTDGTSIVSGGGQHIDKSVQVAFNATAGTLGSYAFNTKTCSATTCHGNASPAWGGSTTCASCHESMGAWGTSTDTYNPAHQKHAQSTGYDFSCQNCHNSATTSHATGPVTTFQSAEVKFNAAGTTVVSGLYGNSPVTYRTLPAMTTNPYNAAASAVPWYTGSTAIWATDSNNASVRYSAGTCGNVYCHSNAAPVDAANSYVNATWSTTPMTCGSCHSASGGSLKHAKHVTTYGFTCKNCHDSTVSSNTTISNAAMHVNAVKDVVFNVNAVTTGTYNNGTGTCTNIYCHSDGTANAAPFSTPLRVATWTTLLPNCDSCHGSFGAGLTSIASRAHSKHLAAGYTCNYCHNATAASNTALSTVTYHANYNVTVQFNATAALTTATYMGTTASGTALVQKAPGSATGTCNATACHGGNSGNWGTANNDATCVKCHGVAGSTQALYTSNNDLAAPGYMATGVNTAGTLGVLTKGVSNDAKVGAHDVHLRGLNGFGTSTGVECNQCHAVTAIGDAGHMNGSTTFTWGTLATNRAGSSYASSGVLAPTYSAPTCANVYCHGGAFTTSVRGSGFASFSWVDGNALGTASVQNINDCNKCHQTPPTNSSRTTAHGSMTTATFATDNCTGCHGHKGSGATHINGKLEAAGGACDGCHSYDVVAGNWGTNPYTNWGSFGMGAGAHAKHIPYLKARYGVSLISTVDQFSATTISNSVQKVCGACHMWTGTGHMNTTVRQITFGGSNQYQFGSSMPTYNGSSLTNTNKTCSNLDCHYKTSPTWN